MRTSSRGQGLTGPTPPALGHMEALPFAFGHRVSEYHLFTEGIDRSTPVGVVVRLHVDGAEEFRHPDGLLTSLARVTAERNMILAALLTRTEHGDAPGGASWRRTSPGSTSSAAAGILPRHPPSVGALLP